MLEVVDAVTAAVGADRVGIRLSPFGGFLDATDATPVRAKHTHTHLTTRTRTHTSLASRGIR
jgi:2,4-dienoyl-CoA reductase-like NADH-dependent reductase (Old Yellow Enzyme family)